MTSFLDHALALAERGFPVFPLQACSKEPYPKTRGFLDASTDPELIRKWWAIAPDSNIGLNPPDGVIVLDVDPRNAGHETLARLEAEHGALPETLTAKTGGGGLHAFFLVPDGLSWPKDLAPGIDIKSHRGYVLAEPSIHPDTGKRYEWLTPLETRVAPAPAWVIAKGYVPDPARVIDEDEGELLPEAEVERLVVDLQPLFEGGKKHAIAYALGGWLRQRGWNSADVVRAVEALPSRNPRARVKDALDGYRANQGWHGLRAAIGEAAAARLDASAPNPRRQRELDERAAAAELVPAMAAGAVVYSPPAAAVLNPAAFPSAQVAPFTQAVSAPHVLAEPDDMIARLRRLQNQGPAHPTGVPPLDKALRGGMREEKIMIVGGAPGAGKTALLRQIADYMCRGGVCVAWLAADEEPSAIDGRRLQAVGVPRVIAEQPDEATLKLAARELSPLPFVIYDSSEGWTIERVFSDISRRYPNHPRAVFVDSVQTVRTDRTPSIDSERKQIDDVLMTAKALARTPVTRAMVVFSSELGRGSYRSEAAAEATSDLAAFKESGGIEYYGHILLVLRSVKGEGAYVDATMPKNRLGPKVDFVLKMDFETTNLSESFDDPHAARLRNSAEALIPQIQAVLERTGWPGLSGRGVKCNVTGDDKAVDAALKVMRERKMVVASQKGNAMLWSLVPNGASAAPASYAPPPLDVPALPPEVTT